MDKIREDFEGWAEEAGALPWGYLKRQRNPRGGYSIQIYTYMWQAWQASRKVLVVTLPEVCAFNLCDLLDKKEVIEHIRAAGITVKGEGDEQTNVLSPE